MCTSLFFWKCIYLALGAQLCRLNAYERVHTCACLCFCFMSVSLDVLCLWKCVDWLGVFIFLHIVSIWCYEISASHSSSCICLFCDALKWSPEKALKKCSASVPKPGMCETDLGDWVSRVWHVNDTWLDVQWALHLCSMWFHQWLKSAGKTYALVRKYT